MRPPLWSSIDTGHANPYTCRTLLRVDEIIHRIRGTRTEWSKSGHLTDGRSGLRTHFPGWIFLRAADIQNRWR